jgi:hypothetical protein
MAAGRDGGNVIPLRRKPSQRAESLPARDVPAEPNSTARSEGSLSAQIAADDSDALADLVWGRLLGALPLETRRRRLMAFRYRHWPGMPEADFFELLEAFRRRGLTCTDGEWWVNGSQLERYITQRLEFRRWRRRSKKQHAGESVSVGTSRAPKAPSAGAPRVRGACPEGDPGGAS